MPGSGNTTVPASVDEPLPGVPGGRLMPALVIVWSAAEPHRVGEIAFLEFATLAELLLGREDLEALPDPRLLCFLHQSPGRSIGCGPLKGKKISRRQLLFRLTTDGGIEVQCIGTPDFLVNGRLIARGTWKRIEPGDVLQIAGHSSFLFLMRPEVIPALSEAAAAVFAGHRLGEPDAVDMTGDSPVAWALRNQLVAAVRTGRHVLLEGDTGVGKEPLARGIHRMSGRPGKFVGFNGATLVTTLGESQLFGNVAKYPNPGDEARPGFFGEAEGGTLLFDEIHVPSEEMQAKLLRALDTNGEINRLGESTPRRVNLVVVAATNQPAKVKLDLLKRFGYVVQVPPLSARMEDIPLLARNFVLAEARKPPPPGEREPLAKRFVAEDEAGRPYVRITQGFMLAMLRSSYEGNIRDLQNLLLKSMAESSGNELEQPSGMPVWREGPSLPPPADDTDRNPALDSDAVVPDLLPPPREVVVAALEKSGWNQLQAAAALKRSRYALKRLMDDYGIKRPK